MLKIASLEEFHSKSSTLKAELHYNHLIHIYSNQFNILHSSLYVHEKLISSCSTYVQVHMHCTWIEIPM